MTKQFRVYGIVQGVGFRPFVSRLAERWNLRGSVANRGSYVEIFAQGQEEHLLTFEKALRSEAPERSTILKMDVSQITDRVFRDFQIIESEKERGDIFVSPDIATCPKCRKELFDPKDRRYLHPFINCTACGPRLTILDAMPYDRERTSMKEFPMCPQCQGEYDSPESRRYDAQPVCCMECGPEVYLVGRKERGADAITVARKAISQGKIVAIKGIGGFHLCCDAKNHEAVTLLRQRKQRPAKPCAVMMRDMEAIKRECIVPMEMEEIIDGPAKPILLLSRKKDSALAEAVAPGNPSLGVMLPYAPVQMLLFDYNDEVMLETDCFVMTSGNVSGAPICRTDEDALKELSGFCDIILSHNRRIRLRADDSVMDYYQGEPYMIRRSRGYAPLPVMVNRGAKGSVLAVGGELKNTFCLGRDQLFYPSPFIGDMGDLRTVDALRESIGRMEELLETTPEIVACDLHPKYNTTMVASELGLPVLPVQHHYAHIVSCMAENNYSDKVIGVAFDGTGYGTDGSIWGGEFLVADFDGFDRVGSIAPFCQIGGDASAKQGWRIALSMINALYPGKAADIVRKLGLAEENVRSTYEKMAQKRINAVTSTSVGRLFDAVSAILGICMESSFEGEASMALQFAAQRYQFGKYPEGMPGEEIPASEEENREESEPDCDVTGNMTESAAAAGDVTEGMRIMPTDRLVWGIIEGRLAGEPVDKLAYEFHVKLADQIVQMCENIRCDTDITVCALSGGVFQNRLLLSLCDCGLKKKGFHVLRHRMIPPNDGGICLGQAVVANRYLAKQS